MSLPIEIDPNYLVPDVTPQEVASWQSRVDYAHATLVDGNGLGSGFLGWMHPAELMDQAHRDRIKATAKRLREKADVMVVVGIGGSYLGARAAIEALAGEDADRVVFAGQTLSPNYMARLLKRLQGKRWCINVVSKSGTTTEPAVAFRLLRNALEKQFGKDAAKDLIVATTDPDAEKSALRRVAQAKGYEIYDVPPNVGGRFSVLSAVGILPIAFAGVDVDALVNGAADCCKACESSDLAQNPAYYWAAIRNLLYRKGKDIELLAIWDPRLQYVAEWWKQLVGESEGKDHISLFPASVQYTTDLHSMGQWVQEGRRNLFETFLDVRDSGPALPIPEDPENADGLNFLTGAQVGDVNRKAFEGTALAHRDGGVPNLTISIATLDAYNLGALFYFFERAVGVSGYLMGVNPFDQPGVEAYKNNMFALLNKPGYEAKSAEVKQRVEGAKGQPNIGFK
ncbi:MAG TPA: glucose-6-phosphate isomerase [Armatimonadota bacterium]|jgi:glucose-6-phosphate isomerase